MTRRQVAIYGAGYLGQQVLHHLLHHHSESVTVIGFIDDTKPAGLDVRNGLATIGSLDTAASSAEFGTDRLEIVFAIGYASMRARGAALDRVLSSGYRLFTVINPLAIIEPGVTVDPGCTILAGAILDQGVSVGAGSFIDIGVRLGADTTIGMNNYLSSGTSTGSRVRTGNHCFFGMDCTVTTDVGIGSNVFVNAKSLIARDLGDDVKFVELHKSKQLPIADA